VKSPRDLENLQTINLSNLEDHPPFGDAGWSQLISELNRFEKLPRDLLTVVLSEGQTDQREIMRRITGGVQVFVGMNSGEVAAGMAVRPWLEIGRIYGAFGN
jgi:hypothetical protein